jgi:alpha-galactosidase
MLSKGTFRNLYTYGYDSPEGYAIEKDGSMFYAFFAPEPGATNTKSPSASPAPVPTWSGQLQLRGLEPNKNYRLTDYVNNKDYGLVTGPIAIIPAQFEQNLLLQATPILNPPNH